MVRCSPQGSRLAKVGILSAGVLFVCAVVPGHASAQWGGCHTDPKVWLDDGSKFEMATAVDADSSVITHMAFTVHMPPGTSVVRVQNTAGVSPSFESVSSVQDSLGGFTAGVVVTTVDGASYGVKLTAHLVNRSSVWSSANGFTNSIVQSDILAP